MTSYVQHLGLGSLALRILSLGKLSLLLGSSLGYARSCPTAALPPRLPLLYRGYRAASLAPHAHCEYPGPSPGRGSHAPTPVPPPQPCRVLPTTSPLSAATREAAFVHAIASAGVAFAVTRSCAEGSAAICGCSSRHQGSPGEGWKWGGCSEDIEFGGMVSREFADARENRPDARSAMNRHNNEAGRQVRPRPPPPSWVVDPRALRPHP